MQGRLQAPARGATGPTGCGKSTCIRLLQKELEPTKGQIRIAGRTLGEIPRGRVPYLRRNIGVVFQDCKLLANRTVHDNVAYSLQVIGESCKDIRPTSRTSAGWSGSPRSSTTTRTSCRARSSSACRSRARSCTIRRCSSPTNPRTTSTPRPRSGSCS